MRENYKTIYAGGEGEITEKKSRFIATVRLVEKEEDALAFIEEMKKKYWDARHNCYAYSIGEHREFTRCSDDGEPSGTAGRPMLDVILGEDIYNVAVVVTRYFGGVLLGTGGLVRAYSGAVQAGLGESTVIEKHHGISLALTADYTAIGKLQYIAAENQLPVLDTEYTDKVIMHLFVPISADGIILVNTGIVKKTKPLVTSVESVYAIPDFLLSDIIPILFTNLIINSCPLS